MGTAQPIRNEKELEAFRKYYLEQKQNYRNYALICLGVNSALRISDILKLKWSDVYDAKKRCFRKHIIITEKKTGKENRIAINSNTKMGLQMYLNSLHYFDVDEYIFAGQKEHSHLCRSQAFRIVKQASAVTQYGGWNKLPLYAQNIWILRVEIRHTASSTYGYIQPLVI